jgi:hypothetical protein
MGTANVNSVVVTCVTDSFALGGTVKGLTSSGLVVAGAGQTVSIAPNSTTFVFPNAVRAGTNYNIVVQTQPQGQSCTVTNGSGVMAFGPSNSAVVTCTSAAPYGLGGTISGLTASGLILSYNNGYAIDLVPINSITFSFGRILNPGTTYSVTVQIQPTGLLCTVANGSGTVANADVTNVAVTCTSTVLGVTTVAGGSTGLGTTPTGIAVGSNGTIYWTSATGNGVYMMGPDAVVWQIGGNGQRGSANGVGTNAGFWQPTGIALDGNGNLFVADTGNNKIRRMSLATNLWSDFSGTGVDGFQDGTAQVATFGSPSGLAIDSKSNLYVTSLGRCSCMRVVSPAGSVSTVYTGYPDGFVWVAVDSQSRVFFTSTTGNLVQYTPAFELTATINGSGSFSGGIAIDSAGNIFAPTGNVISKAAASKYSVLTTVAGTGAIGQTNGPATVATFTNPTGIAVSSTGAIYVGSGNLIRRIGN